jgi:hypothetical protein
MGRSKVFVSLTGKQLRTLQQQIQGKQISGGDAPLVTVGPTLAAVKAGTDRYEDLARHLATIKAFYEAFGRVPPEYQSAVNAPVPIEIIADIGKILAGKGEWAAKENEAKTKAADARKLQFQHRAEEIWKRSPHRTAEQVAKEIVADPAMKEVITIYDKDRTAKKVMKADSIRRLISKPPK